MLITIKYLDLSLCCITSYTCYTHKYKDNHPIYSHNTWSYFRFLTNGQTLILGTMSFISSLDQGIHNSIMLYCWFAVWFSAGMPDIRRPESKRLTTQNLLFLDHVCPGQETYKKQKNTAESDLLSPAFIPEYRKHAAWFCGIFLSRHRPLAIYQCLW